MKAKILSCCFIVSFFLLFSSENGAQTVTSTVSGGNWNSASTWIGGIVPGAGKDVVINGSVYVNTDVTVQSVTISSVGILQNEYNARPTLTATSSISNNGIISVVSGYYSGFYLATGGNITNNGTWYPHWTTLTGANTKQISAASGKRFQGNFQSLDSTCTIKAASPILFTQSFDLKKGILDLQTNAITLAGSGNISNGKVINTNDLILIEGAALSGITYSGNLNLLGLVQINGYDVVMEGSVTITDTLQNLYDSHPTLTINGSLINNGVICVEPGYYSGFYISINGNITNNGVWTPNLTTFTGPNTKEITSANGKRFEGNFQSLDSTCTIKAKTALLFTRPFDLTKGILDLKTYALTLAGSGNIMNGKVINTNDFILIEGAALYNITYSGNLNLRGLVQINGYDVVMEGSVTITDTLQNLYDSHPTLTINGPLINNGVIRVEPGYYSGFYLTITGNITNNGIWWPNGTTFAGSNNKEITLADGKRLQGNFQNSDTTNTIKAKSNLLFTGPFNLNKSVLDMQNYALTLAGSGNISNNRVINTKDLKLIEGAAISSITYAGTPNLRGLVQINGYDVAMEGNVTVIDTLQNVYNDHPTLIINGSLINTGLIKVNPGYYSGFYLLVSANVTNSGDISSTPITLNGTTDQSVMLANDKSIKNRVIFDSKLGGTNYVWYKNGISIGGAAASVLNFDSLNTTNYGIYQCSSSVGSSRYFSVKLGYVDVKDESPSGFSGGPVEFNLSQNYPNPFNPSTKIEFSLKETRFTIIKIYGPLGNEIRTLVNKIIPSGKHSILFDGSGLPSGIYFYEIKAGDFVKTNKMLLLK
jgi:hypothetical protein